MSIMLTSISKPDKVSSNRESALAIIFALQSLLSLGWIASYPYAGHMILLLWATSFIFLKFGPLNYPVYGLLVGIIVLFYMFPRSYGSGNTAWHLSLLVFTQLIFLDRSLFSQIFSLFIKYVLFLCMASLLFRVGIFYGLEIPYKYIDLDPQFFNLHWPFYIERLNTSGDVAANLVGSFRFQGPFFEPGALGIALGICLYGDLSRWKLLLILFFGVLSLSMAFFFIGFFRILEHSVLKRGYKILVVTIIILAITVLFVIDKDGYLYASTFGRFLGTNDKVLNTRLSMYELEQIALYTQTFSSNLLGSMVGIGWDVPGSGGSYRVWLLGCGLFGLSLWLYFYVKLLGKLVVIDFNSLIFRTPVLLILCYIWGNWMSLLLLFLWYKRDKLGAQSRLRARV